MLPRKGQREIDREFRQLERDERRVQAEIKKEAKRGNMVRSRTRRLTRLHGCVGNGRASCNTGVHVQDAARMMAKELVRLRAAKTKLRGMSSHMGAMGVRATVCATAAWVHGLTGIKRITFHRCAASDHGSWCRDGRHHGQCCTSHGQEQRSDEPTEDASYHAAVCKAVGDHEHDGCHDG